MLTPKPILGHHLASRARWSGLISGPTKSNPGQPDIVMTGYVTANAVTDLASNAALIVGEVLSHPSRPENLALYSREGDRAPAAIVPAHRDFAQRVRPDALTPRISNPNRGALRADQPPVQESAPITVICPTSTVGPSAIRSNPFVAEFQIVRRGGKRKRCDVLTPLMAIAKVRMTVPVYLMVSGASPHSSPRPRRARPLAAACLALVCGPIPAPTPSRPDGHRRYGQRGSPATGCRCARDP